MSRKDELDGLIQQIDKQLAALDELEESKLQELSGNAWKSIVGRLINVKGNLGFALTIANPPEVVPTEQLEKEFDL